MEPKTIGPNQYGVIAFDNNNYEWYGSCGSVSWQIMQKGAEGKLEPLTGDEEDDKGRRLNIAYFTSWE